ncbi:CorA metal ion transporter, partial [Blyttiomyces sp. JEL0837]
DQTSKANTEDLAMRREELRGRDDDDEVATRSMRTLRFPQALDYDAIAEYFDCVNDSTDNHKNMSLKLTDDDPFNSRPTWRNTSRIPDEEASARTPRFTFYSDAIGVLRAAKLDKLRFKERIETLGITRSSLGYELSEEEIAGGSGEPVASVADVLRSGPFWIDVCDPTTAEMASLTKTFGIHPLTTEDVQTQDTREKCEVFPNYNFIVFRTFDSDQYSFTFMQPINVYIIVFRECVLSFHVKPIPHPINVLRRIDQLKVYGLNISPDWLNYALIDDITDGFMPLLRFIELEVDTIDDLVLILKESEQSDMLRRIGHARKRVMMLLRLLITKADVLKAIIKRCAERLAPESETTLYLSDIQDHVIAMLQTLNHCEKTLARSHSNYLAQISIEITQSSNRTSDVVMRMTALASILIPLNVITGLWGMNVRVPGEDGESLLWFFGIVTAMAIIAFTTFIVVRRYKLV